MRACNLVLRRDVTCATGGFDEDELDSAIADAQGGCLLLLLVLLVVLLLVVVVLILLLLLCFMCCVRAMPCLALHLNATVAAAPSLLLPLHCTCPFHAPDVPHRRRWRRRVVEN